MLISCVTAFITQWKKTKALNFLAFVSYRSIYRCFTNTLTLPSSKFCRGRRRLSQMCPAVRAQIPSSTPAGRGRRLRATSRASPALRAPQPHHSGQHYIQSDIAERLWHIRQVSGSPGMGRPRSIHAMHPSCTSSVRPPAQAPCRVTFCASADAIG